MKRILIILIMIGLVGNVAVFAKKISVEETQKWKDLGVSYENDSIYLKRANIFTPEEYKIWKNAGIRLNYIYLYKNLGILNPSEAKLWKEADFTLREIQELKKQNVTTVIEAKKWRKARVSTLYISQWKQLGINTPIEVKKWRDLSMSIHDAQNAINAGLDINTINQWNTLGIKELRDLLMLKNGGFANPKQYEPYKGMHFEHAIKLQQWKIKPNKLIESMSYINNIFSQNLYFSSADTFKKAYALIENECDEIEKKKLFTEVDMVTNNDKCYIFIGKMIQRLDEKSLFGKITQKGLISGMDNKYFYAEKFKGDWMEKKSNIGVIKGSGSFSYKSADGTKYVVPQGEVVFLK